MISSCVRLDLEIEVTEREVLSNLGYGRHRRPRPQIANRLEELWPQAAALPAPRGAFAFIDGAAASGVGLPEVTPLVAIGVCTIGAELEDHSRHLAEEESMLDALLVDAYGSAAAEATADALNLQICEAATQTDLRAARRISPGYGDWDLGWQRDLLALLPASDLGITTTAAMMMVPRKSVSFAARLYPPEAYVDDDEHRCEKCAMAERCPYRDHGELERD